MKRTLQLVLLVLISLFLLPDDVHAQYRRKKKKKKTDKKEQVDFAQRMWYGGGFGLSFGGSGFSGLSGNNFQFGLSPMAGYKVLDFLSVGVRTELNYFTGRYQILGGGSQVYKVNAFSYGIGPMLRAQTPWNIFGHAEFSILNEEFVTDQITLDNRLETFRETREALYLGAGYNSSGFGSRWGYEFYLVYDVLAPENTVNLPIYYRFGITYNFQ